MIKKLLLSAAMVLAPVSASTVAVIAQPNNQNEPKVTICHRTNSVNNPYVRITVDRSAVDGQGGQGDHFEEHRGPVATSEAVAQQLKDSKTEWGDIIPPVEGAHGGLNWTAEGQAIYNNDCKFAQAVTPQTPPARPPVAPQAGPTPPGATLGTRSAPRGGQGAGAQAQAPSGAVESGFGGAAGSIVTSLAGVMASLASLGYGIHRLRKTE